MGAATALLENHPLELLLGAAALVGVEGLAPNQPLEGEPAAAVISGSSCSAQLTRPVSVLCQQQRALSSTAFWSRTALKHSIQHPEQYSCIIWLHKQGHLAEILV